MTNIITIHQTNDSNFDDIMYVQKTAFGGDDEATLTANLLKDPTASPTLSLLAYDGNKAVGHILFTKVTIKDNPEILTHLLAPLAVIPDYQKQGIGGKLIKEGINQLKNMESKLCFVLGHITYYPKYGFTPDAKKLDYPAPYPIADEVADAWMVYDLTNSNFDTPKGQILCANTLNKEEYWTK